MSSESNSADLRAQCEARSAAVELQMRRLWIPGRRKRLVNVCYDIGQVAREAGAFDLSEKYFRTAIGLMHGRKPWRWNNSLSILSTVAACHNLLGIQYDNAGRLGDAVTSYDEAIKLRRELRQLFPKDRQNEVYLGGALCNRGHVSVKQNASAAAMEYYKQSLDVLRQPRKTCECSYWDEERQSWWCETLESIGETLGLEWVAQAPLFIDSAYAELAWLESENSNNVTEDGPADE